MDEATDRRLGESLRDYATRLIQENTTTLRDQFAMAALTGIFANHTAVSGVEKSGINGVVEVCYKVADAMLEARKVQP